MSKQSKTEEEKIQSIITPILEKMTSSIFKEKPKNIVCYKPLNIIGCVYD